MGNRHGLVIYAKPLGHSTETEEGINCICHQILVWCGDHTIHTRCAWGWDTARKWRHGYVGIYVLDFFVGRGREERKGKKYGVWLVGLDENFEYLMIKMKGEEISKPLFDI